MTSLLPQYQRLPEDDIESGPSWISAGEEDEEMKGSTYPPRPSSSTAKVTFIFVPQWPIKGKQESVMGVMGRDKAVSSCNQVYDSWDGSERRTTIN